MVMKIMAITMDVVGIMICGCNVVGDTGDGDDDNNDEVLMMERKRMVIFFWWVW